MLEIISNFLFLNLSWFIIIKQVLFFQYYPFMAFGK
jgi:hypothetical protein